tara:strand:+ start:326 stop:1471 length:1146 start_codon:yes stop_codon:yes gene_type:complete
MKNMKNLGLPQNKTLVLKKFTNADNKRNEVAAHVEIWRRITAGRSSCSRFITTPYSLTHPTISVQNSAIPKGYLGMALNEFLKKELATARPNLKARIKPVIIQEMVQALSCLHNHGVVHSDVKLDNFMVYYKPDFLDIRVKIIDMGLATLNKENKPLIRFTKTNNGTYLNTKKLQQLLKSRFSKIKNNGFGLYANSIILPWRDSFKQFNRRVQNPNPELKGRTSWIKNDLFNHLSNNHDFSRRGDGNVRLQNATQDLYKLEDEQARKVQAITRGMLNRKRISKIRNEAKPVKKAPSVKHVRVSLASAASPKTNAARPKTNANSRPKQALRPLSPKRTERPGSNIESILWAFESEPSATKPPSRMEALLKTHSMPFRPFLRK